MKKPICIYTFLPGDMVKLFSPARNKTQVVSQKEFEALRDTGVWYWLQHESGDVSENFKIDATDQVFAVTRTKP